MQRVLLTASGHTDMRRRAVHLLAKNGVRGGHAPADCGQLRAIPDERESCARLGGEGRRARAVSWSSIPASSTTIRSP